MRGLDSWHGTDSARVVRALPFFDRDWSRFSGSMQAVYRRNAQGRCGRHAAYAPGDLSKPISNGRVHTGRTAPGAAHYSSTTKSSHISG